MANNTNTKYSKTCPIFPSAVSAPSSDETNLTEAFVVTHKLETLLSCVDSFKEKEKVELLKKKKQTELVKRFEFAKSRGTYISINHTILLI